jgi:alpha-mannosidase
VDIGYTDRQDAIIDVQIGNLEKSMALAAASAGNPPGMRFKWNPEAVWALDHFLKRATPGKREAFIQAVRRGDVGVDGLYGNMLTGLCRPEELAQCLAFGARLSNMTGVPVESASICDVPGYTWGLVSMMRQAGVKYFAIGPNFGDRVGTIHLWDNKPFYWKSPSGLERVLCWVVDNYHHFGSMEEQVLAHVAGLGQTDFPYDMSFLFWVGVWPNGGVDNAPPDEQTAEKVKAWNDKYAAPRLVIGLTGEYFREFERRNAPKVPEFSGDLTPYWEDGAGSTSRETAMNRATADRLAQADTLFAMRDRKSRPGARFDEAWKNVLLYSEHTWGAWCSISKPDDAFTKDQWAVKQSFALDADKQSRELLKESLRGNPGIDSSGAIDVYNTTQWPRTDLATVPAGLTGAGVADELGKPVPSQRLSSGEWVFLASDVPPFGSRRYKLTSQPAAADSGAQVDGLRLLTKSLSVELNATSGAVKSLRLNGSDKEFVDAKAPVGLNDYRYMLGTDAKGAAGSGPVKISVLDAGPVVAAVRIESDAPGCSNLVREIRLVEGLDRVEFVNHVNRLSVRKKEGVHFGFGFNVPGATLRMETPWAVVRPNVDQLPGSCRNWFTVQRWVDISNKDYGVTWAPLDAPLMEIGAMTANLLGSVGFNEWMTNAIDSQTLYSWAQNNHWHTNYKIDQPGLTTFRFLVRPHRNGYSAAESARFGMETTRPLIACPADSKTPAASPLLSLSTPEVLVETVKLSDDGKALIVRLFGVSGTAQSVRLNWKSVQPASVWLTDLTEKPLQKAEKAIAVPAYGVVNVRAEIP